MRIIIGTIASSIYTFRKDLITSLITADHEVYTFISEYKNDEILKIKALGAIPITYESNRGGMNPLADSKATYALLKKIKEIAPDLVYSYFSKPVIFGTLAAKLAKVPRVIGMLEGLGYAFTEQPEGLSKKAQLIKSIQVLLYKIALPQLDKIIFLNPDDPKDLLETYHIKVKQVDVLGGIGLDLDEYNYQPIETIDSTINFLFIGRMLKEKGIHDFISAAKIVKQSHPDVQFTVLGAIDPFNPGALQQCELDRLISLNIINYPGQVDNVQKWIAASHVFVLPSYREGLPTVIIEAMACECYVIATDCGGSAEILGDTGQLVSIEDSQSLADALQNSISLSSKDRMQNNKKARVRVEEFFSLETSVKKWLALYEA